MKRPLRCARDFREGGQHARHGASGTAGCASRGGATRATMCPLSLARWRRRLAAALAAALAPLAAAAQSTQPPHAAPRAGALSACLILPERAADLGSPLAGVVESVDVERGDLVRKGQVLARLRADVERASVEATHFRAQSEAEWRGALAAQALAKQKLDRARSLQAEDFVSGQAVEQAAAEFRVAEERALQARDGLAVSAREAGVSRAQLAQRVIRSPYDGVVTERHANPGERFEDKPLLRVAVISRLRIEVVAATSLFGRVQIGQEAQVTPELPGAAPRRARVAQIDRVLDPASNTFRLRLDLPNEDLALPAGLRCKVDFGDDDAPASRPSPAGGAAPATRAVEPSSRSAAMPAPPAAPPRDALRLAPRLLPPVALR